MNREENENDITEVRDISKHENCSRLILIEELQIILF